MKILRAEHLGMCFGVRDAIELAVKTAEVRPVTVLGDLVHNETVLSNLRSKGIEVAQKPEQSKTRHVLVTAHGASEKAIGHARSLGLHVSEATCPLVHLAHRAVRSLVSAGFHPVIIGKRDHVEVRGLTEDLEAYDVVLREEDISALQFHSRIGVAAQTTQPVERVEHLLNLIRQRFPGSEVRFADTVCRPTKDRQRAAIMLARRCTVVVVIGGANSNNTHELAQTCSRYCDRVYHVQAATELQAEWFKATDMVGITAGTSTPDTLISGVELWLRRLASSMANPGHAGAMEALQSAQELQAA